MFLLQKNLAAVLDVVLTVRTRFDNLESVHSVSRIPALHGGP